KNQRANRHCAGDSALGGCRRRANEYRNGDALEKRRKPWIAENADREYQQGWNLQFPAKVSDPRVNKREHAAYEQSVHPHFCVKHRVQASIVTPLKEAINRAAHSADYRNPACAPDTREVEYGGPEKIELLFDRKRPEMNRWRTGHNVIVPVKEEACEHIRPANHMEQNHQRQVCPRNRHEAEKAANVERTQIRILHQGAGDKEPAENEEQCHSLLAGLSPQPPVMAEQPVLEMVGEHQQNSNAAPAIKRQHSGRWRYLRL